MEGEHGKDLVFVYPNDIRGRGFMLQYVSGVTAIEPATPDGRQVVHTIDSNRTIGIGYIRVAEYV